MSQDDFYDDEPIHDEGTGLANGVIVVTGIILIAAIYLMSKVTADQYPGVGWLG